MNRELRMLYRDIPAMSCRPGCTDCCGPVPWSAPELARVRDRIAATAELVELGPGMVLLNALDPLRCPFAQGGTCAVYEARPAICRLFGTAPAEPRLCCPHGCKPARPLSPAQAAGLRDRILRLPAP